MKEYNTEPNAMVILRPNYSFYAKKIVLNIMNYIPTEYEYVPGEDFDLEIPIPDNLTKLHRTNIKSAIEELTSIKIKTDTKYKYGSIVLFPSVEIDFKKNLMKVGILKKVLPRLVALKKQGFIKFRLNEALALEKKHSQRLFELIVLQDGLNGGLWEPNLVDFKSDMFIHDKYKGQPSLVDSKVIIPSIEDINKHTSFNVIYSRTKSNLRFEISSDKKDKEEFFRFVFSDLTEKQRRCWDKLISFGIIDEDLLQYIVLDDSKQKAFWLWLKSNKENIASNAFRNTSGIILNYLKVNSESAKLFLKRKNEDTQTEMFDDINKLKKRMLE